MSGEMSMIAFLLCLVTFAVVQTAYLIIGRREHRREMAELDELAMALDDRTAGDIEFYLSRYQPPVIRGVLQ